MGFLECMCFVLAVFPLKYGFIIVQNTSTITHFTSSDYQQTTGEMHAKASTGTLPIFDNRWGFSKGKSTTGTLVIAVDNNIAWHRLLEAGNDVCAVFFNHRKVFDGEYLINCLWINQC